MTPGPHRRDVLRLLLGGAAGLALPRLARAQATTAAGITVTPLAAGLRLVSGAGGNVVVCQTPDGLLLVNGGAAAHADDLHEAIGAATGGGVTRSLFNTDWHHEHTGSNVRLRAAGADLYAHVHTGQYLSLDRFVDWQDRTYPALPAAALPTQTVRATGSLAFGPTRVEYGPLGQAHTDGDLYVFFPDANVLVAGDVLTVGRYPIADYTSGGWLGGLVTATKTLLDLADDRTQVIPGHGPVQTRADLSAQHEMLGAARERIAKLMRQGLSADDMRQAGVTREFDARWGDPDLFLATSYRGMWLHVRELGGIV